MAPFIPLSASPHFVPPGSPSHPHMSIPRHPQPVLGSPSFAHSALAKPRLILLEGPAPVWFLDSPRLSVSGDHWSPLLPPLSSGSQVCVPAWSYSQLPPFCIIPGCFEGPRPLTEQRHTLIAGFSSDVLSRCSREGINIKQYLRQQSHFHPTKPQRSCCLHLGKSEFHLSWIQKISSGHPSRLLLP